MASGVVHLNLKRAAGAAFLAAGLLIALALSGCAEDENDQPPLTPDEPNTAAEFTERGWEQFEKANFSDALNDFNDAIILDTTYGEAYNGLGWTRLSQATSVNSMRAAVGSFVQAIDHGENGADVLAGRAAANLGVGGASLDAAVADAQAALAVDDEFVFIHRPSFDAADLHLVDAFAKAAQGDFPGALAAADLVFDSGVEEGNPNTWVVDDEIYDSFNGAVLAHLHLVSEQFSG